MPSLWSDSQDSFDMCLSVKTRFLALPRLPVLIFSVSSVPGTLRPLSLHPPHPFLLSYLSLVSGTVELTRSLLSPALSCTCRAVLSPYSLCSSTQVCAYTYVHTPLFNWGWLENSASAIDDGRTNQLIRLYFITLPIYSESPYTYFFLSIPYVSIQSLLYFQGIWHTAQLHDCPVVGLFLLSLCPHPAVREGFRSSGLCNI